MSVRLDNRESELTDVYNLITRTPEGIDNLTRHGLYFDMIHSTRPGIGTLLADEGDKERVRESLLHFDKFLFKDNQVHLCKLNIVEIIIF